jgi:hypothetical protein
MQLNKSQEMFYHKTVQITSIIIIIIIIIMTLHDKPADFKEA